MKEEDGVDLDPGDFRIRRRYLHPSLFVLGPEGDTYPPPSDLIAEDEWDGMMILPTDVLLKSTSYEGALVGGLQTLQSNWIFSWPEPDSAPYMNEVTGLAGEEFDALVFNAAHGWYRQAIGCLRNALEILIIGAGLAVTGNQSLFDQWRNLAHEIGFGQARAWLRDSNLGQQVDADAAPGSVFGDDPTSWTKARYKTLCAYAHSQSGYNNSDFWESNGPVFRPRALQVVDEEFRQTLALSYLLVRLAWPSYTPGPGQVHVLDGPQAGWSHYDALLRNWLLI